MHNTALKVLLNDCLAVFIRLASRESLNQYLNLKIDYLSKVTA